MPPLPRRCASAASKGREVASVPSATVLTGVFAAALSNTSSERSPSFVETARLDLDETSFAAPAFADLDADGDDDVILGTVRGGLWLYENRNR